MQIASNPMKTFLLLMLCTTLVWGCCNEPESEISRDTIEYFKNQLKPSMTFAELALAFGEPDDDIGSGIHIYVYNLDNGTRIYIGFTDNIIYARHVDAKDALLEELI